MIPLPSSGLRTRSFYSGFLLQIDIFGWVYPFTSHYLSILFRGGPRGRISQRINNQCFTKRGLISGRAISRAGGPASTYELRRNLHPQVAQRRVHVHCCVSFNSLIFVCEHLGMGRFQAGQLGSSAGLGCLTIRSGIILVLVVN